MNENRRRNSNLPPEQEAIRAKCFHPTGTFVEFRKEEVEQSIPDRFGQQVLKHPDRLAVKSKSLELTFDALPTALRTPSWPNTRAASNQLPSCWEHGSPMIVAILGVLKAGRVYVPLDSSYPHHG